MAILVAFDKHYFEAHVPIAKKIPGLRKYEVSQRSGCNPWGPFHCPTARNAVRLLPSI
jgi:uncharacterized protein (TIGR02118 family)